MKDLEKFYEKYQKDLDLKVAVPFMIILILISVFLFYIFKEFSLKDIFDYLNSVITSYPKTAYFLVFLSSMVEAVIVAAAVPGSTAVLVIGAVAAAGGLKIELLYVLAVIGAFLGDNISYILGSYFGPKILKLGLVDPLQYKVAQKFLEKHGGKSVFFARIVSGMKELIPFIAGSVKMPIRKFQFFNFLGALMWAFIWLGLGFVFYKNLDFIDENLSKILTLLGVVFVVSIYVFFVGNKNEILKD